MPRAKSTPRDEVPAPGSDDRGPDIVNLMDIPVTSPIPILRLKTLSHLRRTAAERKRSKKTRELEERLAYGKDELKRLQKLKRRRSTNGLPISTTSFPDLMDNLPQLQEMDEEFHVGKNLRFPCECRSCKHLKRWSSILQPYRCTSASCKIAFESFTDMYEHQLEVHGGLDPRSNRVVNDTFRQQRGMLAYPPPTVYAAQQFMVPSRPPTPWKSMKELDEEAKIVRKKLVDYNQQYETPYKLFDMGYKLVKKNGWKEVQWQYQIAMEHFYSGFKFPASSRRFRDGCPSVERGRNWLTSTDREDARVLQPFSLGDKTDVEPEFVLIDTKRDQEMQEKLIELSDDSADDILPTRGRTRRKKKTFKKDDDVEMKTQEDDDDSIKLKASGGGEANTINESKVFEFDSDSDVSVKSEVNTEGELKSSRTANARDSDSSSDGDSEEELELKDSRGDDSNNDSDSGSDRDSELKSTGAAGACDSDHGKELEVKVSKDSADETVSDTESSNDDEIDVRASKGGNDDLVSDSDSSSDDKVELNVVANTVTDSDNESKSDIDTDDDPNFSKTKLVHEVTSSSEDSDSDTDVETNLAQDESSQFVSDTDSERDEEHKTLNSQDDIFN
ncbi:hypothetical protein F441_14237 [Phytophthora nicotianae CJ01A1]|uniref:C2H2-type domain-containing protein n=4 Tax=Phytophthora nicotianae TaxID=4792 RepID=V9ELT9_PHYNI|nr:hypothetical protein F443_14357 [Phytophthora nicotianae P1569]ETL33723.1 hypothetical protein L916_13897 [Phytophthora nicotianae]ETM40176.1 hypothetical protein L914_13819 [Phytophthora nicotianae]ETO68946.1 hypothetical protein F444_14361 [Phytophthora nicotianae P1976]ETP09993.1 hypothetical protein F441_14237 [Phytophthora nicotianae CJ01A1]